LKRGERVPVPITFLWRGPQLGVRPNTWTYFQKVFTCKPGQSARVLFSADPTARLWVNGVVVMTRVMRFVTPQITVEPLDLRPFLKSGRNVVTVLHHFGGVPTFQRSSHGQAGVGFDADGCLGGGDGWWWHNAGEFLPHAHQTQGGGYGRIRFPVVMDMRKSTPGLHSARSPGKSWKPVVAIESAAWSRPVLKETAALERKQIYPARVVAVGDVKAASLKKSPVREAPMSWLARHSTYRLNSDRLQDGRSLLDDSAPCARLKTGGDGYLTLDFGRPVHGYLRVEIADAEAGTVLDFTFGETRVDLRTGKTMLHANGSFDPELVCGGPYGDRVVLRGGKQTVEIPEERTCRWLMATWRKAHQKDTRVRSVSMMTSQHPAPTKGSFACPERAMVPLVRLGLDHARVTMSDTYVDTPGREDAQWLEDIQYRARLAAQWFGDTSLRQVTLRHAVEQQREDGLFRVFAPEEVRPGGITHLDWAMTWIGLLCDDWWWTGSLERVERYFPALERFVEALQRHVGSDGLFDKGEFFSDIRTATRADLAKGGRESLTNAWLAGFLRQAAEMAAAVGQGATARIWRKRADRVRDFFPRFRMTLEDGQPTMGEIWTPESGAASPGQAAVINTVYHGLAGVRESRQLLASAFREPDGRAPEGMHPWNNPTYAYRALRVLAEHGQGRVARTHLMEKYGRYLPDGPLPEYFLMGEGQQDDPTGSHGWASVPLVWLHDTVLGLRLASPGGKKLLWQPRNVGWQWVRGRTMTPLGPCQIEVDWEAGRASIRLPEVKANGKGDRVSCRARLGNTDQLLTGSKVHTIRFEAAGGM
jgi:hypothetical protein